MADKSVWIIPYCVSTDRFLIARRSRTSNNPLQWNLFGGGVDKGEKKSKAAVRELREEAGLKIDRSDLVFLRSVRFGKGSDEHQMNFYLLRLDKEVTPRLNPESDRYKWVTASMLPQKRHKSLSLYLSFVHKKLMKRIEEEKKIPMKEVASNGNGFSIAREKPGVARLNLWKYGFVVASVDFIEESRRLINLSTEKIARADEKTNNTAEKIIRQATQVFPVKDIAVAGLPPSFLSKLGFTIRPAARGLMEYNKHAS